MPTPPAPAPAKNHVTDVQTNKGEFPSQNREEVNPRAPTQHAADALGQTAREGQQLAPPRLDTTGSGQGEEVTNHERDRSGHARVPKDPGTINSPTRL